MKYPCAQRTVVAVIKNGKGVWFGSNWCHNKITVCPRRDDEDYTLCRVICNQASHAEADACREAGINAKGGTLYLFGHTHYCDNCGRVMQEHGIERIIIM